MNRTANRFVLVMMMSVAIAGQANAGLPKLIREWGTRGSGPGEIGFSIGFDVSPDGTVWIADSDKELLQHFAADGTLLGTAGSPGSGPGQFNQGIRIAIGADAHVFTAEQFGGVVVPYDIQEFSPDGVYLRMLRHDYNAGYEMRAGRTYGRLYFLGNFWVDVLSTEGAHVTSWNYAPAGATPGRMAVGPDDRVYVSFQHTLAIYDPTGVRQGGFVLYPPVENEISMAVDSAGNVYVSDSFAIHEFSNTGTYLGRFGVHGALRVGPDDKLYALGDHMRVYETDTSVTPTHHESWGALKSRFR